MNRLGVTPEPTAAFSRYQPRRLVLRKMRTATLREYRRKPVVAQPHLEKGTNSIIAACQVSSDPTPKELKFMTPFGGVPCSSIKMQTATLRI